VTIRRITRRSFRSQPASPSPAPSATGALLARPRSIRHDPRHTASAFALAAPAVLLLLVLYGLPTLAVLVISVSDWRFGSTQLAFVGLSNFAGVLSDPGFRASLANTVTYVAIVLPGTAGLGLVIALLIESRPSFRAIYRAIHFLPFMATLSAMAIAWDALLNPSVGLVNHILTSLGFSAVNWLNDDRTVLPVLAAIGIWQGLGYAMVLFMAGLKSIPGELYDAAQIDGADGWLDRLCTVTLPMLAPVTMFVVIVVALRALQIFDIVQILTKGGPGHASEMLLYTLYRESFDYLRAGQGAAIAMIFLGLVVALTLTQARFMDSKVHYQ